MPAGMANAATSRMNRGVRRRLSGGASASKNAGMPTVIVAASVSWRGRTG